jgi:hypothetical protein
VCISKRGEVLSKTKKAGCVIKSPGPNAGAGGQEGVQATWKMVLGKHGPPGWLGGGIKGGPPIGSNLPRLEGHPQFKLNSPGTCISLARSPAFVEMLLFQHTFVSRVSQAGVN